MVAQPLWSDASRPQSKCEFSDLKARDDQVQFQEREHRPPVRMAIWLKATSSFLLARNLQSSLTLLFSFPTFTWFILIISVSCPSCVVVVTSRLWSSLHFIWRPSPRLLQSSVFSLSLLHSLPIKKPEWSFKNIFLNSSLSYSKISNSLSLLNKVLISWNGIHCLLKSGFLLCFHAHLSLPTMFTKLLPCNSWIHPAVF